MSADLLPDLSVFNIDVIKSKMLSSVNQQIETLNGNLKTIYLNGFRVWAADVEEGRCDAANPPRPPLAYVTGTDGAGWPAAVQGSEPVVPMPPLPKAPSYAPVEIPISALSAMPVPAGDAFPVGTVLTAPDGSKWRKSQSATPFGSVALYYARI